MLADNIFVLSADRGAVEGWITYHKRRRTRLCEPENWGRRRHGWWGHVRRLALHVASIPGHWRVFGVVADFASLAGRWADGRRASAQNLPLGQKYLKPGPARVSMTPC